MHADQGLWNYRGVRLGRKGGGGGGRGQELVATVRCGGAEGVTAPLRRRESICKQALVT